MAISAPSDEARGIAVFDFDGTLIEGDSLWAFFAFAAGWPRVIAALVECGAYLAAGRLRNNADPELADARTYLKALLLLRLLAGRKTAELTPVLARLRGWLRWKDAIRQTLLEHHAKGHHIVIATGALDLYLPALLEGLPHDAVLCTHVGVANGVIEGTMPDGNCVRERKAEMVAAYLAAHGPFGESWGYGNLPHDLPMLNLLKHQVIV